jgi:hypothetical protein
MEAGPEPRPGHARRPLHDGRPFALAAHLPRTEPRAGHAAAAALFEAPTSGWPSAQRLQGAGAARRRAFAWPRGHSQERIASWKSCTRARVYRAIAQRLVDVARFQARSRQRAAHLGGHRDASRTRTAHHRPARPAGRPARGRAGRSHAGAGRPAHRHPRRADGARGPVPARRRGPRLRVRAAPAGVGRRVLRVAAAGTPRALRPRPVYALPSLRADTPSALPALASTQGDHAEWLADWAQAPAFEAQLGFWRQRTAPVPVPPPRTDMPRRTDRSGQAGVQPIGIDGATTQRLHDTARGLGVTLELLALGLYALTLGQVTGRETVDIAVAVRGREQPETQGVMGRFDTAVPVSVVGRHAPVAAAVFAAPEAGTAHACRPPARAVRALRGAEPVDLLVRRRTRGRRATRGVAGAAHAADAARRHRRHRPAAGAGRARARGRTGLQQRSLPARDRCQASRALPRAVAARGRPAGSRARVHREHGGLGQRGLAAETLGRPSRRPCRNTPARAGGGRGHCPCRRAPGRPRAGATGPGLGARDPHRGQGHSRQRQLLRARWRLAARATRGAADGEVAGLQGGAAALPVRDAGADRGVGGRSGTRDGAGRQWRGNGGRAGRHADRADRPDRANRADMAPVSSAVPAPLACWDGHSAAGCARAEAEGRTRRLRQRRARARSPARAR